MTKQLITRLFPQRQGSFFLFGPRGSGKSTFLRQQYQDTAVYIDLLNPAIERSYIAKPERLYDFVAGNPNKVIIIDELQRVPSLLTVVHDLIETKNITFVLTGSSARKLKRSGVDLLAGRAIKTMMHPFMAAELQQHFSLENALEHGLLPLVFNATNKQEVLETYISIYLKEEIQQEGLIRRLDDFTRFLETIAFSHAQVLNISNVARECNVKRKTVESYIDILEDLLLAYKLPLFTRRAQRQLITHPKFYYFDAGVFKSIRKTGILDKPEEINGAALEGLVMQHLKSWDSYSKHKHELAFWRTKSGLEIDFVIYGSLGLWAIEVKNSKNIGFNDTKALEEFLLDYPEAKALLLYRGGETLKHKNVLCMPVTQFLLKLLPDSALF